MVVPRSQRPRSQRLRLVAHEHLEGIAQETREHALHPRGTEPATTREMVRDLGEVHRADGRRTLTQDGLDRGARRLVA